MKVKQSERVVEVLRELSDKVVGGSEGEELTLRSLRVENLLWEETRHPGTAVVDSTLQGTVTLIVRIRKTFRDKTA
jgi:hypothetical protein